jgi:Flp pilus assembly protein TadD/outer membrane biosynthesis protein TonB
MKKALTFALAFSSLALGLTRGGFAQDNTSRNPVSVASESGNSAQDKLNGPVRRVRVETTKIILKDGNWVEGPREVLAIVTYDPTGRKIDSATYPVEASKLPGKEQYLYDDKGNVVEMILRSADGSILSRETYEYEFDQLGNWTKMNTSVAVYEDGKISFEPTGITYRAISYYYNQAIEKLDAPSVKSKEVLASNTSSTLLPNSTGSATDSPRPSVPAPQVKLTLLPSEAANAHAKKEPVNPPASVAPDKTSAEAPDSPVATSSEMGTTPDDAPATNVVQRVAEDVLRNAAIELPKPEYSDAALLARASGKVKVQVLVGENGHVAIAQATSGHPLLTAAAETAARNARFSLTKMSSGATRVYGVISYDFALPTPASEAISAISPTTDRSSPKPVDPKPEATPASEAISATSPTIDRRPPKPLDRKPEATPASKAISAPGSTIDKSTPKPVNRKPEATPASIAISATSSTIDRNPPKPIDRKPDSAPIPEGAAFIESKPKAAANYSEAAGSFYDRGVKLQAAGRYAEAAEAFNQAIRVDPNDANAYARLGMAYSATQKHKDAIVVYKMAVQTNQSAIGALAYYMWGHSYLALDKNSDALSAFKQALYIKKAEAVDPEGKETQRYPSLEQLHYAMGIAYLNSNRFTNSIDELKQVVALNPKNAEAYYALAMAYFYNGNRREAESQLKTLSSLNANLAQKITSAFAVGGPPPGCRNIACR